MLTVLVMMLTFPLITSFMSASSEVRILLLCRSLLPLIARFDAFTDLLNSVFIYFIVMLNTELAVVTPS